MKKLILIILSLLIALPVNASVIINEVAWMGTPIDGVSPKQWWRYEWLELYNQSETNVSLNGWSIELNEDYVIPLSGLILPNEYYLIVSSDKISNYDLNYSNLAGKFNNSGQLVQLKNSSNIIVDTIDAREGWFSGDNDAKLTMSKKEDGAWGESMNPGGTPKAKNIILKIEEPKKDLFKAPIDTSVFIPALTTAFISLGFILLFRRRLSNKT